MLCISYPVACSQIPEEWILQLNCFESLKVCINESGLRCNNVAKRYLSRAQGKRVQGMKECEVSRKRYFSDAVATGSLLKLAFLI
jgi:hypothetical protein